MLLPKRRVATYCFTTRATYCLFGHATYCLAFSLIARLFSQRVGKREPNMTSSSSKQPSTHVTEERAAAQRAKLDAQVQRRAAEEKTVTRAKGATSKGKQAALLLKRRASTTVERAIADYLLDHEGGNSARRPCSGIRPRSVCCAVSWNKNAGSRWWGKWTPPISTPGLPPAQNAGSRGKTTQRAHHPDLRPLGPRLLSLAGAPRDHRAQSL